MNRIKMGVLDFGRRAKEINGLSRLEDVIHHAIKAEELGFTHFWVGEHHTKETRLPWGNPDILLPVLAGLTKEIRVGVAGTLLLMHSPYSVALNFKLLANMFPNRVDLGLAKGVPDNTRIVEALIGRTFEMQELLLTYRNRINDLMRYLKLEDELQQDEIIIPPFKGDIPEIWYLGTAFNESLDNSLEHGINYCRSLFHGSNNLSLDIEQIKLNEFRMQYENKYGTKPRINIALAGVCHESEIEAKKIADKNNITGPGVIIGTPERFAEEVYKLNVLYGVDEFTFFSMAAQPEDIIAGDTLISEIFSLRTGLAEAA